MLNEHVRKLQSSGRKFVTFHVHWKWQPQKEHKTFLERRQSWVWKEALEMPPVFFVTVRHLWYSDLGTWTIIFGNNVALPTSPSAGYRISLWVWSCSLLNQRVAQKIRNIQDARVTAVSAQVYYTFLPKRKPLTSFQVHLLVIWGM
jgi:hypothetical protein